MSTPYESWITKLRVAWMGPRAQRIFGAFASVLGDRALEWARQANLEHMPGKAADLGSLPLIGSERLMPQGRIESTEHYRERLTQYMAHLRYMGRPLGLLMALYWDGYTRAVLVQQNGKYYTLNGALDEENWPASLEVGTLNETIAPMTSDTTPGYSVPSGIPWWAFDSKAEVCSRFAVLLPEQAHYWRHVGVATFEDTDTVTVTWNRPFADTSYHVQVGAVWVGAQLEEHLYVQEATPIVVASSKTPSTVTLKASGPFYGQADVIGWVAGENPFAAPDAEMINQLRNTIATWKPGKATCMGIYALIQGELWGWPPIRVWGSRPWNDDINIVNVY